MYRSIEDFIKDWEMETQGTLKVLSAITETTRKEKIHADVRSLGRLGWHLAQTVTEMGYKAQLFAEDELEYILPPSDYMELIDLYQQYCGMLANSVKLKWTDSSLMDQVEMYGEKWERGKILRVLISHQTHHRGQMTVIMRMLGLLVPGIYGPAKEEWAEYGMIAPD
uniref:DinB family protein n=1 Tax=Pedobacter schmidteae TaxID=2201271 RepID=UPI000EAE2CCA|nr:DinB family protein [Pedobacter schmidteae]